MTVSKDASEAHAADLLAAVDGEAAAIADLAGGVERLHRAQAVKVVWAALPSVDLRRVLSARRRAAGGGT